MESNKYFDWKRGVPLTEKDSCSFEAWSQLHSQARAEAHYARLDNNIFVFLDMDKIEAYDKYKEGVFSLELNMESVFHKMRVNSTIYLLEHIKEPSKTSTMFLDVGCGSGQFLEEIRKRLPNLQYTGLDVSLTALRQAASRVPNAEYVLADAHDPPFAPEYFDIIILNNVLEHVHNPIPLLMGLRRILSPDGCLILSTPSRYRFDNMLRILMGKPIAFMSADHVTEYSVGQISEICRHCGFEVQRILGPTRKPTRWTLRNSVSHYILKPTIRIGLRLIKSPHVIESTAFFEVKRKNSNHV